MNGSIEALKLKQNAPIMGRFNISVNTAHADSFNSDSARSKSL